MVYLIFFSFSECSGHPDGIYSYGCKPQYFACSNGHIDHFECPSRLVFNEEYSVCDYPAAVKTCLGNDEVGEAELPVKDEQVDHAGYQKPQATQVPVTGM